MIVADHVPVFSHGLAALAQRTEDISVVSVVDSTVALLAAADTADVAVIDADLPHDGGIAAVKSMNEGASGIAILLLARDENVVGVDRALTLGASGVLPRARSVAELFGAIRTVAGGELVLAPAAAIVGRNGSVPFKLTDEDLFLLELLVSGAPQADIARRLIVSESTLKRKFADLQRRLGATNRFDAVARAARSGLI